MQSQNLVELLKRLFYEKQVEELLPQNMVLLSEEELSPFSDYYGALIDSELFLKNKTECRRMDAEFDSNYAKIITHLYANLFVPNLKTLTGKLNDRVRKALQKDGTLPGSKILEESTASLEEGRDTLSKLNRLGFPSTEKKKVEEEFFQHLDKVINYAELLQEYLFKTRPQKIKQIDQESLFGLNQLNLLLLDAIQQGKENYSVLQEQFKGQLHSFAVDGEEIRERDFYYNGKIHQSTAAFVKEWNKVLQQIGQLEEIRSSPAKRKRRVKFPNFLSKKTAVAASLLALVLGGVLVSSPYLRYRLKLPTSQMEKVELYYDAKYYQSSLELLDRAKEISPDQKAYWQGKIKISQMVEEISKADLYRKYDLAKSLLNSNISDSLEKGILEEGEKEILNILFDAGYIKRKDYINFQKDTGTPRKAAQSHLCGLFESNPQNLVEEEKKVLESARKNDIFYVGEEGEKVYFLISPGSRIIYHLQKKDSGYGVKNISFE
ncbi:MAG: hypothetical protein ABIA37_04035 [Candidatus Woesearchaeota archaeon]